MSATQRWATALALSCLVACMSSAAAADPFQDSTPFWAGRKLKQAAPAPAATCPLSPAATTLDFSEIKTQCGGCSHSAPVHGIQLGSGCCCCKLLYASFHFRPCNSGYPVYGSCAEAPGRKVLQLEVHRTWGCNPSPFTHAKTMHVPCSSSFLEQLACCWLVLGAPNPLTEECHALLL